MPESEKVLAVLAEWVQKAENDLDNAAHTLARGKTCPTDTVCFHAQQCVEKYLKAILVLRQTPFPKTHDIEEIVSLLPSEIDIPLSGDEKDLLTNYAGPARYPGWRPIPLAEARRAVAIARRVRKQVRRLLPGEAIRRRNR